MRVMVLYNPVSGMGRALRSAERLRAPLKQAGHEAVLTETRLEPQKQWLDALMSTCQVAVVVGGDGAMRLAGGAASRTNTPVYHYPLGTENLFAREFGHDRSVERLVSALERGRVQRCDLAIANGRKFLLMASIGFDAEVVHDLAGTRGSSISHLAYVRPVLRQLRHWRPPTLTVRVDDRIVVQDQAGCVIVANCRQYAGRCDPARRASMTDGLLDVVFLPAGSRRELMGWVAKCRAGVQLRDARLVYERGADIEVIPDQPRRFQLDGDPPEAHPTDEIEGDPAPGGTPTARLQATVRPGALPVLLP